MFVYTWSLRRKSRTATSHRKYMCESAGRRGRDSATRETLDAQYRYTVGLAPLYYAPRKYHPAKKCCYPSSRPVSSYSIRPSVRPASSPSLAGARARAFSISPSVKERKYIGTSQAAASEIDDVVFSSCSRPPVLSLPLVSARDSGRAGAPGERSPPIRGRIPGPLTTVLRRRYSRSPSRSIRRGLFPRRRRISRIVIARCRGRRSADAPARPSPRSVNTEDPRIRV